MATIKVTIREFYTFKDKEPFHTFTLFCYSEEDVESLITDYANNFYSAIVETDDTEPNSRTFNVCGYNTLSRF